VAENRVWINEGQLKIIKPVSASKSSKKSSSSGKLSVQDAREIIRNNPKQIMHSVSIEEEAFYRLRNYPSQIKSNMHHAMITLPRKIAYLLNQKPSYVAPAIEAFYLRDPIALKPLNSKDAIKTMIVPPTDVVNVSVRFPKVAYAQLKSQDFPSPAVFKDFEPSKAGSDSSSRIRSGIKLTCGFEMLLSDSHHQDKSSVREMKLLLDDLESGDEYLPTDTEIESWSKQEDDEKWLDINFADLEKELGGQAGGSSSGKKREFGDKAAQENLQRIVKQFEGFLNDDKAGPDGAGLFDEDSDEDSDEDLDDDDLNEDDSDEADSFGEDKDVNFNEDEFSKMMQEMMGMPANVMREIMSGKLGSTTGASRIPTAQLERSRGQVEEIDQASSDGEDDLQTVMEQMGRELREHGALNLSPARDNVTSGHAIKGKASEIASSDDERENDIDINLVKNLLESFKAQSGMAGPGSNMMGLMGMKLPRDEIDGDGGGGGPSGSKGKQ
jgi:hypothetical protein